MQTFIATTGTSLLTNRDEKLPEDKRRLWLGKKSIGDQDTALAWMKTCDPEHISAETNTFYQLGPDSTDVIHLLHSDTNEGLECARLVQRYLIEMLELPKVYLHRIPGVTYDSDGAHSSLENLVGLLQTLINSASGSYITLAATGGFKSEVMMMAVVGQQCGIPVCYIHEKYRSLIYLPYLPSRPAEPVLKRVSLPDSTTERRKVNGLSGIEHHRPKGWEKLVDMLVRLPWVEHVRYDEDARHAPRNGVRLASRKTGSSNWVFWINYGAPPESLTLAVETTGNTEAHREEAIVALRETISRLC